MTKEIKNDPRNTHCEKKHPCPDCKQCQWCADSRCKFCKGWLVPQKHDEKGTLEGKCKAEGKGGDSQG